MVTKLNKKSIILIFLHLVLLCNFAISQPKAVVGDNEHNFGTVIQGEVVQHSFIIENKGDQPLIIHSVKAQCGCTAVTPPGGAIEPGQSAPVLVVMDTAGFDGNKVKSVRVFTNDSSAKELDLTIKGTVEGGLEVNPVRIQIGEFILGSSAVTKPVAVLVKPMSSLTLKSIFTTSPNLKIDSLSLNDNQASFNVTFSGDGLLGSFIEKVFISASSKNDTEKPDSTYVLPVVGKVISALTVEPKVVSFGVIDKNKSQTLTKKVKIASANPSNRFNIKSAVIKDPINQDAYLVEVKEFKPQTAYLISVTLDPSKLNNDIQSVLSVVTSDPIQPNIDITVYGVLPPK